jgi:hypothetical protein
MMTPVSFDWAKAFLGQAATQEASSHSLQVNDILIKGSKRTTRIRDFSGLKASSFSYEQAYSQTQQPTHLSGSAETNFLA